MQVHITTDSHIPRTDALVAEIEATIDQTLARFAKRVSRVSVHLTDENAAKEGGNDKRCVIEAHANGVKNAAVDMRADTIELAIDGAAEKLERHLEHTFGRLDDIGGRTSYSGEPT